MTFLIALLFLGIVGSLGHALFAMASSGPASSDRMVRALTVRIVLSLALFGVLAAGNYFG